MNPDTHTSLLKALRDYFLLCPLLSGKALGVDFPPPMASGFSIQGLEDACLLRRYWDGSSLRQLPFRILMRASFLEDTRQNLAVRQILDTLADWVEQQTRKGVFPQLPGGKKAQALSLERSPALGDQSSGSVCWSIQCRLTYYCIPQEIL